MKVGNFLKIMLLVTTMAVLYIHLQMSIYSLAYQGKKREDKIDKLVENNVNMRNDILRLKSSENIGQQLLVKEKDYKFVSRSNVVEVEAAGSNPMSGLLAFAKF